MFDSLFVLTFLRMCIAFLIHSLLSCVLKFVLWGLYPPKAHYLLDLTWRAAMPLLFHSLPGQGGFVPRAKFQGFASKTRDLNLKIHLYIYIHYQTWCRALPYFTHFKPFNIRSRAVQVVCISEHGYPCLVTFFFSGLVSIWYGCRWEYADRLLRTVQVWQYPRFHRDNHCMNITN
jgi:hypothetical protein